MGSKKHLTINAERHMHRDEVAELSATIATLQADLATAQATIAELQPIADKAAPVVTAWTRLGACEAEFYPEYPGSCSDVQEALDQAIGDLDWALHPAENERLVKQGKEVFNKVLDRMKKDHS